MKKNSYDAVVVGSGPNGLAAGIRLAQEGLSVLIVEAGETIGGGVRSAELTLPGYVHDVCSAIHPLALGSPFFKTLPLDRYGLEFVQPPVSLAHPFDDGTAATIERSIEKTSQQFGDDGGNYRRLLEPLVENWEILAPELLAPLRFPAHPFRLAQFGLKALRSAQSLAHSRFGGERAKAVFAGVAAHGMVPLEYAASAAVGLVLTAAAHSIGWAFPRGGAGKLSDALTRHFLSLGGEIKTSHRIENADEIPAARAVLFDLTPRQIIKIANHRLPENYKKRMEKFRYGSGAFKIDFALSEPIPWLAKDCLQAGTVHLGGTLEEIAESERENASGKVSDNPFVLVAQNSLFDSSRAPAGKQVAWTYCHVPNGSNVDMTERIENQIERFAPGFRDCIEAKAVKFPADLEIYNANCIGGDINGGANILSQFFSRPVAKLNPYAMPVKGFYICSSSTPPNGGVHGMCGFHAAQTVLKREFGIKTSREIQRFANH